MVNNEYEIHPYDLGGGVTMLVLKAVGRPSFIDDLVSNGKTRQRAARIVRSIRRLLELGVGWGFESETLKRLRGTHGSVALFEVRCRPGVIRVMTYLHDDVDTTPVFLFDFDGHSSGGSTGGIPSRVLKRGERLALVARDLMDAGNERV